MPRSELAVAASATPPCSGVPGSSSVTATVLKSAAVANVLAAVVDDGDERRLRRLHAERHERERAEHEQAAGHAGLRSAAAPDSRHRPPRAVSAMSSAGTPTTSSRTRRSESALRP